MNDRPVRKTERLRHGRVSLAGACYFFTACVQGRSSVLTLPAESDRVFRTMDALSLAGDWRLLAATIMPDHLHVLFTLGERLPLDRVTAKLKSQARPADAAWRWQANGFEHRLRAGEDPENYAFYLFMNPYRAGLIPLETVWPGWQRQADWKWRFEENLNSNGTPPGEWLDQVEEIATRIRIGE